MELFKHRKTTADGEPPACRLYNILLLPMFFGTLANSYSANAAESREPSDRQRPSIQQRTASHERALSS